MRTAARISLNDQIDAEARVWDHVGDHVGDLLHCVHLSLGQSTAASPHTAGVLGSSLEKVMLECVVRSYSCFGIVFQHSEYQIFKPEIV